jgi:hypothetical protein
VERRKRYWNGTWGRLARRDIVVFEDGGRWLIEYREGGADGKSRWYERDDEDAALEAVRGLMADSTTWRELA